MFIGKLFGVSKVVKPDIDHISDSSVPNEFSGVEALTENGWVPIELIKPCDKLLSALEA